MPQRCSVECSGDYVFHYTLVDGVCYMALFDRGYPKNLAFAFLSDINRLFQEELKREYGTGSVDYRSHIDCIEKPYHFIKFDRPIAKKKLEYRDPNSSKALSKLSDNLTEVSSIMKQNIDEILKRGESLDSVSMKAHHLRDESNKYKNQAAKLSFHTLIQKYGVPAVLALVVLVIIFFKFFRG